MIRLINEDYPLFISDYKDVEELAKVIVDNGWKLPEGGLEEYTDYWPLTSFVFRFDDIEIRIDNVIEESEAWDRLDYMRKYFQDDKVYKLFDVREV